MTADRFTSRVEARPAHLVFAGVSIVAVTFGFARYAYGLFLPNIRTELGLTTEISGLIASGSSAGFLLATILAPIVTSRAGSRLPVVLGGLSATLGMAIIAIAWTPWILTAGVVLAGTSPGWAWPPMSDAVVQLVPAAQQNRAITIIGSGTSFGVLVAGPLALLTGSAWRPAWLIFSVLALAATVWNARLLPVKRPDGRGPASSGLELHHFLGAECRRLFLVTFIIGLASSVYWTFAVDLIARTGSFPDSASRVFWILVGGAGVGGTMAGDLITRFGLRKALQPAVAGLAVSMGLLPMWLASWLAILTSAILFGATFIIVTVMLGVWSVNVFHERPSAGLGAQTFVAAIGQVVGPFTMGLIAGRLGLLPVFLLAAALAGATTLIRPRADLRSLVPEAR